jgi:hypothetical protein
MPTRLLLWTLFCLLPQFVQGADYHGKKILFVDSYHSGYAWSDGIEHGIRRILDDTGVELRVFRLNSRRQPEEAAVREAALQAKALIESFQPDVVIAADDNASKYLVMPYYQDAELPFVFCGVNWDASIYGYPYHNATGMVEVDLLELLVKYLQTYARGRRVGSLAVDQSTEHKLLDYYRGILGVSFERSYFVKSFAEWKSAFRKLQSEVDVLVILNPVGITDWDRAEAIRFVQQHTRIPSGSIDRWLMPFVAIGLLKLAEEQGEWAARTALRILGGKSPVDIPLAQNFRSKLVLNLDLLEKLKLQIDPRLTATAEFIRCPPESEECVTLERDE